MFLLLHIGFVMESILTLINPK